MFQLHPGAWHFAAGHIPKLELLGQDSPYVRTSNGQFSISVSDLQLRLPVHEAPGAPGTPPSVDGPAAAGHPSRAPRQAASRDPTRGSTAGEPERSRHGITVSGTAGEHRCATAPRRPIGASSGWPGCT